MCQTHATSCGRINHNLQCAYKITFPTPNCSGNMSLTHRLKNKCCCYCNVCMNIKSVFYSEPLLVLWRSQACSSIQILSPSFRV